MVYFYDTNALLSLSDKLEKIERFFISSVTLMELEHIKTNKNKTEDVRYKARKVTKYLTEHVDDYEVIVWEDIHPHSRQRGIEDSPDVRICDCVYHLVDLIPNGEVTFVTDDLCCRNIAQQIYHLCVAGTTDSMRDSDEYTGFKEISVNNEEMAYVYEHLNENVYELLPNQYLILKDEENNVVDTMRWDGQELKKLFKKNVKSLYFEKLKAKDVYQSCAIDTLVNCPITAISGKAGSGKSLLSLMVAMYLIETGVYERIVVMFNPTKTRGASDLGYYSGDFIDKAMANSIGNILTTKFGDRFAVDVLMQQNKLKLVSMADCRGMEIKDDEILWITECQNTSIDLIKLCLSRVSSGAKVIVEGDYLSQVDSHTFSGENNGLKRLIDTFKGHEEFGFVQLQNVWRSKIAELCELL